MFLYESTQYQKLKTVLMEDILKPWWLLLVGGLLFLVLGFVSLAYPMTALLSVALYIGLIALATGIMSLAFAFSNMSAGGWSWRLFEGIVDVLFGLVMLIHPMISAALIPVIIGIWVFIRGLMYLIDALSWRRNRSRDWSGYAVIGVLLMVFGFLMIIDERFGLLPVAYLLAAIFLFVGFASLIVAFSMRRAKRETA